MLLICYSVTYFNNSDDSIEPEIFFNFVEDYQKLISNETNIVCNKVMS